MFGYCCTGSTVIATRPAITMMMATTAAKIGRSMKKRENMFDGWPGGLRRHADIDAPCLVIASSAGHVDRRFQDNPPRIDARPDKRVADRDRAKFGEIDVGT